MLSPLSSPADECAAASASTGGGSKRQLAEPEVVALNELLDTFPSEMDDAQHESGTKSHKRRHARVEAVSPSFERFLPHQEPNDPHTSNFKRQKEVERLDAEDEGDEDDAKDKAKPRSETGSYGGGTGAKHTKLAELEQHVRNLERDNLHLKQALLLGKKTAGRMTTVDKCAENPRLLSARTKVVTEMVELLNATYLSLSEVSRVWHEDCRIGVGVREWDAVGRLQIISLWNMIRSVFASIVVDIVELRPHLPDGEMFLTKWRIQGEIASPQHLERVCASEDCPATMRVVLMAIKSSDLTFTVTTYVVFQDLRIAEQYHNWDQVGVFKRLFGGDIPPSVLEMLVIDEETAAGRKQPLEV